MSENNVDVFICGGGPTGLLLAYQLARLGVSTYVVEQYEKSVQSKYGRASSLHSRSLELLSLVDLSDQLHQIGLVARDSTTWKAGVKVEKGRGWDSISRIEDTFFNYDLNIRQKYSEDVFRTAYEKHGGHVHVCYKLIDFKVVDTKNDEYPVHVQVEDGAGQKLSIQAKYIVGADGGHSSVRHLSGIAMQGDRSDMHWVRVDGLIETDMPNSRIGYASIESKSHGMVLFAALDHGATRIGFAVSQELWDKYHGEFTEEIAVAEAQKAMAPWKVTYKQVDWWTLYSIGQRVAERFQDKERILLIGDAGHTHSSGAAQGMNTGVQDAVNLGWKLAGTVQGWLDPKVLPTYAAERRSVAQEVIRQDKTISQLITGNMPEYLLNKYQDPNVAFGAFMDANIGFLYGLGIKYEQDGFLNRFPSAMTEEQFNDICSIPPGSRAPDVVVHKPGSIVGSRLYEFIPIGNKFWVLVFAGSSPSTHGALHKLRAYLDENKFLLDNQHVGFVTIIPTSARHKNGIVPSLFGLQPVEDLGGVQQFGFACYDPEGRTHARYGVELDRGAMVVVRPDSYVASAFELSMTAKLEDYFRDVLKSSL